MNIPQLFVNASAAKRILGLPQSRKISLTQTGEVVTVQYTHKGEPHTNSLVLAQFVTEFERYRREGAAECLAYPHKRGQWGESYQVTGTKGDTYYVEAGDGTLACTCEDWHQHELVCKHGYAVLNLLGLRSLDEYCNARKVVQFRPRPVEQRAGDRVFVRGVSIS